MSSDTIPPHMMKAIMAMFQKANGNSAGASSSHMSKNEMIRVLEKHPDFVNAAFKKPGVMKVLPHTSRKMTALRLFSKI